jgi:hypothetical protein
VALLDVSPVLVGANPFEIAVHTQLGIVRLSVMTIKALPLCVCSMANIALESGFKIMRCVAAIRNSVVEEEGGITKAS